MSAHTHTDVWRESEVCRQAEAASRWPTDSCARDTSYDGPGKQRRVCEPLSNWVNP